MTQEEDIFDEAEVVSDVQEETAPDVEEGTPEALMQEEGHYNKFVAAQH